MPNACLRNFLKKFQRKNSDQILNMHNSYCSLEKGLIVSNNKVSQNFFFLNNH